VAALEAVENALKSAAYEHKQEIEASDAVAIQVKRAHAVELQRSKEVSDEAIRKLTVEFETLRTETVHTLKRKAEGDVTTTIEKWEKAFE